MDVIILLFFESSEPVIGYVFPIATNNFRIKKNKNGSNKAPHMIVGRS